MKNNSKFIQLMDYFKTTFKFLIENKGILRPIIFFILSRTVVAMIFVLSLLPTITNLREIVQIINKSGSGIGPDLKPIINQLVGLPLIAFIALIIISTFGFTLLEAKLYINYAKIIPNTTNKSKGLIRTFLAFLLANIIIMIAWIVLAVPYVIVGIVSLSIGFALIPFLVDVLLLYYKGIYVVSDKNIFSSLGASIKFAWKNLLLSAILQLIILITDLGNLMRNGSYYSQNLNGFLKYENQDTEKYIEEYLGKINKFIPENAVYLSKVLDIVQGILVPISFLLIVSMAIVFVIKQIVSAYLSLTATYVYCELKEEEKKLGGMQDEYVQ